MVSMAQFGRELADDKIRRLIDEARTSAHASRPTPGSPWVAGALRRMADRIDRAGAHAVPDPRSGGC